MNNSDFLNLSRSVKDHVVIITGAASGIGRATARLFAQEGARVAVTDLGHDRVDAVVQEINDANGKAQGWELDVTDSEAIKNVFDEIALWGEEGSPHIDVLVNNAGITQDNLMMRMKAEQWSKVIDVNLNGVFHTTRAVLKTMMKQRSGKIISISSVVGFSGNPGQVNYSSTKAALVGFTKSLAREVGSRGITVNAVAPGFIDTAMTQALNEAQQEEILRQIPLKRMGMPEDIAHAVDFLASEKADYITGTVLHVNGGMY